ncbi:MAG: ABC transporter ATP-binding protein [Gammaproteobacteria bacterium]|nr:ABC transporter ATP-binding protein [Gammaproteobacteria bacterium]
MPGRPEWQFAALLPRAAPMLATFWWILLVLRGLLPAAFAVVMGVLVAAVQEGGSLAGPLTAMAFVFVGLQTLSPLHQVVGKNLGSRTAAWLYDQLTRLCVTPPGIGHLEDPALTTDLGMARDFDLGITGLPLSVSMDFIAAGLVEFVGGVAATIVVAFYSPLAAVVLAGTWLSTHWLLRESAIWKDRNTDEVREAQRHADYSYRIAVDPPAAKELRLFGLGHWIVERFAARRRRLHDLRWEATRLRQKPVVWSLLLIIGANLLVFALLAQSALNGEFSLGEVVTFASAAVSTSMIAFGGLSWALDGAAMPVVAMHRLQQTMARGGALSAATGKLAEVPGPAREIRFRNVSFQYPNAPHPVLEAFDLTIPAGSSLAIVGQNGAGKTTLAKLLCRLYDPSGGSIEVDGIDLRDLPPASWRQRLTAVFQDFVRFEWSLRDNVAPAGDASDEQILAALNQAGATHLAALDTPLSKAYAGGTDLSGGQWQRVALARALCAVQRGATVVLLDEPTAQLDVRGEAEIFSRVLAATRHCTTILISHRFSTVRQADRICVLEEGRVIELGTHDELMALGGRYCTMFTLQAARFVEDAANSQEESVDVLSQRSGNSRPGRSITTHR